MGDFNMKKFVIILIVILFAFGSVYAGKYKKAKDDDEHSYTYVISDDKIAEIDDINIEIEDGSVILSEESTFENVVEITEDYELYVNDRQVKLTPEQQDLVEEFHVQVFEVVDEAKYLGWEGAKIGVSGAKLGMKAISRLFKMVFTSYDEDDFERDMERDAELLEGKAEKLEDKAKVIEKMADDLKFITEELFDDVPELRRLEWF